MNDEQISALGIFCTEMLSNEAFQAMTQLYSQQCATDILMTKPHELKAREQIYASFQGFEGFLALARKFADTHAKITTEQSSVDTALDAIIDDPSVHDIYDGMS